MSILAAMREKYGFSGGKYEPKSDCPFCDGNGERFVSKLDMMTFCICLFVDHEFSEEAGRGLAATAKKIRQEITRCKCGHILRDHHEAGCEICWSGSLGDVKNRCRHFSISEGESI